MSHSNARLCPVTVLNSWLHMRTLAAGGPERNPCGLCQASCLKILILCLLQARRLQDSLGPVCTFPLRRGEGPLPRAIPSIGPSASHTRPPTRVVNWLSSSQGDSVHPGDLWQCLQTRLGAVSGGRVLGATAISWVRPGKLLNILQDRGQPYSKESSGPNVNSAKVEKPWIRDSSNLCFSPTKPVAPKGVPQGQAKKAFKPL